MSDEEIVDSDFSELGEYVMIEFEDLNNKQRVYDYITERLSINNSANLFKEALEGDDEKSSLVVSSISRNIGREISDSDAKEVLSCIRMYEFFHGILIELKKRNHLKLADEGSACNE